MKGKKERGRVIVFHPPPKEGKEGNGEAGGRHFPPFSFFFLLAGRRASVLFTLGGGGILADLKLWVWPLVPWWDFRQDSTPGQSVRGRGGETNGSSGKKCVPLLSLTFVSRNLLFLTTFSFTDLHGGRIRKEIRRNIYRESSWFFFLPFRFLSEFQTVGVEYFFILFLKRN